MSSTKEETTNINQNKNNKNLIIDNKKNITINSFNTENNKLNNNNNQDRIAKIESYKNKRKNTDLKFNTNFIKNKFSSCDFDAMKKGHSNFSKGLLDRINNIKSKINQGI